METTTEKKSLEEIIAEKKATVQTNRLDMSFGELMSMYEKEDLIISPEFQRLFRWTKDKQTALIESILLGIPIPPIFVAEDEEGRWELIDGLQRISTILSFFGLLRNDMGELEPFESPENRKAKNLWALSEGELIADLVGKTKEDLPLKLQRTIRATPCRVEILEWSKDKNDVKYELFNRLNTGGEPATEQEIRNSIFRGKSNKFNKFLKELAKEENLLYLVAPTQKQVERLYLEELVLRFFALYYSNDKEGITENISKYMTKYMKKVVDTNNFLYEEAKNLFTSVLALLRTLHDNKLFRGEAGPFSNNLYDVVMLGTAYYYDYYIAHQEKLQEIIDNLKRSNKLNDTSSVKSSSKTRNQKRIELAKKEFKPLDEL